MKATELIQRYNNGERDFSEADLREAYLSGASLGGANLRGAYLGGADLRGANLSGANLYRADIYGANLGGADLSGADLRGANLSRADLSEANLGEAYLSGADLSGANLEDAQLPHFGITPESGGFYAWKKTTAGVCKIYVPAGSKRMNAIGSRKCRAEFIKVISGPGCGGVSPTRGTRLVYEKGATVTAHEYCDDIQQECAPGIHFFLTEQEADEWC